VSQTVSPRTVLEREAVSVPEVSGPVRYMSEVRQPAHDASRQERCCGAGAGGEGVKRAGGPPVLRK